MAKRIPRARTSGRANLVLLGFLAIAAFFLFTEHRAHVLGALPWLLLAACPLMHFFMHGEHHGHDHTDERRDSGKGDEPGQPTSATGARR